MSCKTRRMWFGLFLCLALLAFTGCQTVGGLDITKALTDSMNTTSYEGTQTIRLEFTNDGHALPLGPGDIDWSALNQAVINVDSIKKQDKDHLSMEGTVQTAGGGTIPFTAAKHDLQYAIQLDGASDPVVIDGAKLLSDALSSSAAASSMPIDLGDLINKPGVTELLLPYLLAKLPNPSIASVTPVTETVHNESLQLQKLHLELNGSEVPGMLRQLLSNILNDDQGLKDLIRQIVNVVLPPSNGGIDISGIAADAAYGALKSQLVKLQDNLEATLSTPSMLPYTNAKTTLKADLYMDDNSLIRKSSMDLFVYNPGMHGVDGIRISSVNEKWNLGQQVQAKTVETTKNSLEIGKAAKTAKWIKSLDNQSALYKLLMNNLHILRKTIKMEMKDNSGGDEDHPTPYINDDGFTMVPVRFVTEKLDADVGWNGDLMQVTVTDIMSGKQIVLTIGSKDVSVDGHSLEMDTSAVLKNNTTYVPARFIAESFGAQVGWDNDTRTVSIVKN